MGDDFTSVLIFALPLAVSLLGGTGGVVAFMKARTSKKLGVQQNETEKESTAVTGLKSLAESLTAELERQGRKQDAQDKIINELRTQQSEDRAYHARGMDEMRAKHDAVVRENRDFRVVILAVVEQLRRQPPAKHADILAHIVAQLPWLAKDQDK